MLSHSCQLQAVLDRHQALGWVMAVMLCSCVGVMQLCFNFASHSCHGWPASGSGATLSEEKGSAGHCSAMVAGAPSLHVSTAFCCIAFAICVS
jgi:hypothetical protein